ncbi:hypothetical protein ACU5EH_02565 [Aliivibrio salmonicida]|uniref:hypothetical protein n=1 Tax=Aliivibrio salmonicida TaxID=40269 RepID=UPI00406C77B7
MMRLLITIAILLVPFSNALASSGVLTFSGKVIPPPCPINTNSKIKAKKQTCTPVKKEKKYIYKEKNNHKATVGEIITIFYI